MEKINCNRYSTGVVLEHADYLSTRERRNTKRLRNCSAYTYNVYEGDTIRYTVLVSYSTIVAYYDHESEVFCDILRPVYGYTATSAQHIAKFKKDLGYNIKRDIRFM